MKKLKYADIPKRIPTGNYSIDVHLDFLLDNLNRYQEKFNLNLDPDFQRHHVWTEVQQIKFVEFLLQGGKCPSILFNYPNWQKWSQFENSEMVIVDGKQRLTALIKFLNGELLVFKDLDSEEIGYKYEEINIEYVSVRLTINDLVDRADMLKWYLEMNEGQVAHTQDELDKVRDMMKKEYSETNQINTRSINRKQNTRI